MGKSRLVHFASSCGCMAPLHFCLARVTYEYEPAGPNRAVQCGGGKYELLGAARLQYKYVIIRGTRRDKLRWETDGVGNHRRLQVNEDGQLIGGVNLLLTSLTAQRARRCSSAEPGMMDSLAMSLGSHRESTQGQGG